MKNDIFYVEKLKLITNDRLQGINNNKDKKYN